jgi:putative sterol carrier protein
MPQTIRDLFASLPGHFNAHAAGGLSASYQFNLSGEQGGQYQLLVRDATCTILEGTHASPDVTLAMTADDCLRVMQGQLDGVAAALSGKVRVEGNLGLAIRLKSLFPTLRP